MSLHRPHHPLETLLASMAWLALALVLPPVPWAPLLLALVSGIAVLLAGVPARLWVAAMAAPAAFSAAALVPLLWNVSFAAGDVSVYEAPLRSLAAAAALLLLGLTTPVSDLLAVARRAGVSAVLVDLAFLMHRLAVAAATVAAAMMRAMVLRAPRASRRRQIGAVAWMASALLGRILDRARRSECGLAARGVDGCVRPPLPPVPFSLSAAMWMTGPPLACGLLALWLGARP